MIDQTHARLMRSVLTALSGAVDVPHALVAVEDVHVALVLALRLELPIERAVIVTIESLVEAGARFDAEVLS